MTNDDYIPLGPDEVIKEDAIWSYGGTYEGKLWNPITESMIGCRPRHFPAYQFRRPRIAEKNFEQCAGVKIADRDSEKNRDAGTEPITPAIAFDPATVQTVAENQPQIGSTVECTKCGLEKFPLNQCKCVEKNFEQCKICKGSGFYAGETCEECGGDCDVIAEKEKNMSEQKSVQEMVSSGFMTANTGISLMQQEIASLQAQLEAARGSVKAMADQYNHCYGLFDVGGDDDRTLSQLIQDERNQLRQRAEEAEKAATEGLDAMEKSFELQLTAWANERDQLRAALAKAEERNRKLSEEVNIWKNNPDNEQSLIVSDATETAHNAIKERDALKERVRVLEGALNEIREAASGEKQVAMDDTEGLAWVDKKAKSALDGVKGGEGSGTTDTADRPPGA